MAMKEPKSIESVPVARWSDGRKVLVFGLKFLDRIPIHEGDELEFRYYGNRRITIEFKPDADMPKIVRVPFGGGRP